jgi:hypothetical protein
VQDDGAGERHLELPECKRGFKSPLTLPALGAHEVAIGRAASRTGTICGDTGKGIEARVAQNGAG